MFFSLLAGVVHIPHKPECTVCRGVGSYERRVEKCNFFCVRMCSMDILESRNDVVFNDKIMASPSVVIHKTIMLLKTWKPLLKPKSKAVAETIFEKLHQGLIET